MNGYVLDGFNLHVWADGYIYCVLLLLPVLCIVSSDRCQGSRDIGLKTSSISPHKLSACLKIRQPLQVVDEIIEEGNAWIQAGIGRLAILLAEAAR